ncbi:MAG: ComEC/Rec2 family competence protein, partial [Pyrinomonadaceae bacterium]|nr:ComEC/Rec2 family competence protein [Pyrinomonadaceae bacterium]
MTAAVPAPKANRSPLAWLAAAFAFGIVAAAGIGLQPIVYLMIGVGGLVTAWNVRDRAALAACCFAFAALGGFCYALELGSVGETRLRRVYDEGRIASGDPVEIKGTVKGGPEPAFDGVFVKLDASELVHRGETREASGVVRFYLPLADHEARADLAGLDLRHGSIVTVACAVMREDAYLNPGVTPRREILDRQGIDATCTVKSPLMIESVGHEWSPLGFVYELRRRAIERIREMFEPRTAGVLIASSLGDKYFLDRETAEVFREGGTFHVLVISGLHVTFIGGVLLLAVRRFTRRRLPQFLVTTAVLWAFTIAVGAESPAVRASVMFTIALFGFAIFRQMTLINAFGASGLVLLVMRPSDVFDPSFQLTFASVGGIVAMAFPLVEKLRSIGGWMPTSGEPFPPNVPGWLRRTCETIYWNPREWEIDQTRQVWSANIRKSPFIARLAEIGLRRPLAFVFEGLLVSVVVQLWMLPLLIWYFHRVSISSVVLNLWVGPLLAAESIVAAAALGLDAIAGWLAIPVIYVTETLNEALLWLPGVFVEQGWASLRLPVAADEWWMYPLFL